MPTFLDRFENFAIDLGSLGMRAIGPFLCIGLHVLVAFHFYAYLMVISPLLQMRLGTPLGVVWIIVGLILVYNITFNHTFAMLIKPGGPADLRMIEDMRTK